MSVGPQPQRLADQGERYRVEAAVELDVAIAMHAHATPGAKIGRDRRQGAQQRFLDGEQREWLRAGSAVDAHPRFRHHPLPGLGVEIGEIAKAAVGRKLPLT